MKQLINNKYNIIISHVDAWYFDCGFGSWRDTKGTGTCPPFKAWYTVYNYRPWDTMKLNDVEKKQVSMIDHFGLNNNLINYFLYDS